MTVPAEVRDGWSAPLWRRVDVRSSDECWPCSGFLTAGYARCKAGGVHWLAHRLAYTVLVGPIPEGLTIDHLCRTTNCCNPAHMEPVTAEENIARSMPLRTYPYTAEHGTMARYRRGCKCRPCMDKAAAVCRASRARRRERLSAGATT